jgi:adenosylcobinamide-phosphate synthase
MEWLSGWAALTVLLAAALLDYWLGDPWNWLHPVQVIGWGIHRYRQVCLQHLQQPASLRIAGVILAIAIIGLSALCSWLVIYCAKLLHPAFGWLISVILLASCFAGRSLRYAAEEVLQPLLVEDIETARLKLSRYVGRDTAHLPQAEILRAVFETVTENATDGVMAPLFYAILGASLPIGSAPLALAYKAASTLDSMVGYREAPYTDLGWCSARLEDSLTWLPCRLHVLTLLLISGRPNRVWQLCQRDAAKDPSPNSGWSECAYAASLGVQVGGINQYKGIIKQKPLLGDPLHPITARTIQRAMHLTRLSFLLWLFLILVIYAAQLA